MENPKPQTTAVLVDAEWIDRLAFNFIVNFERMLGRRVPPADLTDWLTCLALDAGLRPADHAVDVSVLYEKATARLAHVATPDGPADFAPFSFGNNVGRFAVSCYPIEASLTDKGAFFVDSVRTLSTLKEVERLILVPDFDAYGPDVLRAVSEEKDTVLFVPEPFRDRRCRVENLCYSLTHALGVNADELG